MKFFNTAKATGVSLMNALLFPLLFTSLRTTVSSENYEIKKKPQLRKNVRDLSKVDTTGQLSIPELLLLDHIQLPKIRTITDTAF